MIVDLSFEWYVWVLLTLFVVCFLVQIFYWTYYYSAVLCDNRKRQNAQVPFLDYAPPVSVIICSRFDGVNIERFLPAVLEQDYPSFEVIVVNDGSTVETNELIESWRRVYPNLFITYLPENAQVMSRKKLDLTIGIKAAKNDLLLFIDADCCPISKDWIRLMVRNFVEEKEFVLGYGGYQRAGGLLNHLITYDTFTIALQYMGFALRGHPYMGVGRNMAYSKEMFFRRKGFASILHLQGGDDDLFVSMNANANNTRVEYNSDAKTLSVPKKSWRAWLYQKRRHLSTSSYYSLGTRMRIGVEAATRFCFYGAGIALCLLAPVQVAIGVGILYFLRLLTQGLVLNLSSSVMKERHFYLTTIVADVVLPVFVVFGMLLNAFARTSMYKWK